MIFCIGNGKSRQKIDLQFLKKYGTIYGSNGLYRDFIPDKLVTCDPNMLKEIIESGYSKKNVVFTTEYGYGNILEKIPKEHKVSLVPFKKIYPVNAGWMSIRLAYHFHPEHQIYMIGFDLFGDRKNIYDDTPNYPMVIRGITSNKEFHAAEDERIGLFYLLKDHFCPKIRLTRVIDDDTKIENIDNITTEQFMEEITWQ
jgi:hypothetical protein